MDHNSAAASRLSGSAFTQQNQIEHLLRESRGLLEKHPAQSLSFAQQAFQLAEQTQLLLPETLAHLSDSYRGIGQFQNSLDTAKRALPLMSKNHPEYPRLLMSLGASATFLSLHSEGMSYLLQSLELAQAREDRLLEFRVLNGIGANYVDIGELESGAEHFRKALQVAASTHEVSLDSVSMLNYNLSVTLSMQGKTQEALEPADLAIDLARKTGSAKRMAAGLLQRGFLLIDMHQIAEAESALLEALKISSDIEDPITQQSCYLGLGKVKIQYGLLPEAVPLLEAAIDPKYQTHYETQRAYSELVAVHKTLGQFEAALSRYEESIKLDRELTRKQTDDRFQELEVKYRTELALKEKSQAEKEREWLKGRNQMLKDLVQQRTEALERSQLEMLEALTTAGEHRDGETAQHTERVGEISKKVALKLGMSEVLAERVRVASRLHDVGKIAIPDDILLKPGKLTEDEYQQMKQHTLIGAQILSKSSSIMIRLACQIALSHHERWDGTGYPNGLFGEHIPIEARIVAIADVFDALTNVRPYKRAWSREEALREIQRAAGTQFDPWVVRAFLDVVDQ
ncbi:HD domain-containing phosphohydrolase [Deinococcus roseus]|uniref:HD-GYP domain-containing protein n=1 Tax=Deinococcus roseus TaxID=392414 RepID=A0ABQ2CZ06_9DEIO|nr:HD domain-containing phosphohydrolase [Deinococcus roseus]GGJ30216.1 hypothetical protein GCM10008938_15270 [Deinococcus roseus]